MTQRVSAPIVSPNGRVQVVLRGKPDALLFLDDDTLGILDFKTGRKVGTVTEVQDYLRLPGDLGDAGRDDLELLGLTEPREERGRDGGQGLHGNLPDALLARTVQRVRLYS